MVAKHLMEAVPRASSLTTVPEALDDLVLKMLSKDPAGRPPLAEVFAVIERTSQLDRTNVKGLRTPLPAPSPPLDSAPINIPTPTPSSSPNLERAMSNAAAAESLGVAVSLPGTTEERLSITDLAETIRSPRRPPARNKTMPIILGAVFLVAVAGAYFVVSALKGDANQPSAETVQGSAEPPKTEPAAGTIEPVAGKTDPVAGKTEPAAKKGEPTVGPGGAAGARGGASAGGAAGAIGGASAGGAAGASSGNPPAGGKTEPAAGKTEWAAAKTEPAAGKTAPTVGKTEPATGKTNPGVVRDVGKPATGKTEPAAGKTELGVTPKTPKESAKEPKDTDTPKSAKEPAQPPTKKLGKLQLMIAGGSATKITIDGVASGPSKELAPGPHTVVVSSKGHKTQTVTVTVREGGIVTKSITLEAEPPPKPMKNDELMAPGSLNEKRER
jgi:RNA 3'-terminal phosphate cyclase-like protein